MIVYPTGGLDKYKSSCSYMFWRHSDNIFTKFAGGHLIETFLVLLQAQSGIFFYQKKTIVFSWKIFEIFRKSIFQDSPR